MADPFREAVFRTRPFPVTVAGSEFLFPARPAQEWLEILGSNNWIVATVATLGNEAHERFLDAVEAEELDADDVRAFAHSALAQSAGRPWWEAERLAGACFTDGGRLLGTVLLSGADPRGMTLAAFLACVWAALAKGADAEAMTKLEASLLVPPPEATAEDRAGLDDDMYAMVDRMRSMPGVRTG